jgi:hypothetical protein
MNKKDYQAHLEQDEQRYADKHIKRYIVVQPDVIDPNDPLGSQEPMENTDVRDLVNINDENDRILANPNDFYKVGEIVTEDDFELIEANYIDEQGNLGTAEFAYRK